MCRDVNDEKMAKPFDVPVEKGDLRWWRWQEKIKADARLDGVRIVRTSVSADAAVLAYKRLRRVKRVFRSLKTTQLQVRSKAHARRQMFV